MHVKYPTRIIWVSNENHIDMYLIQRCNPSRKILAYSLEPLLNLLMCKTLTLWRGLNMCIWVTIIENKPRITSSCSRTNVHWIMPRFPSKLHIFFKLKGTWSTCSRLTFLQIFQEFFSLSLNSRSDASRNSPSAIFPLQQRYRNSLHFKVIGCSTGSNITVWYNSKQ